MSQKSINPGKIVFTNIFVILTILLISSWISTQLIASMLGYQSRLGQHIIIIFDTKIYLPFQYFPWLLDYGAYAPYHFDRAASPMYIGIFLSIAFSLFYSVYTSRDKKSTTYGSAKWADDKDLEKSKLLVDDGVFIAQTDSKKYIRHNDPEHILAFAPTRSGKGVGIVIPTLLAWTESILCNDIKGENWHLTSGFRSKFSYCLKFDPTSVDSCCFNPLLEIRQGPNEVKDAQNIADIIMDPGDDSKKDHWRLSGAMFLTAVILHVLYAEKDKSLPGVANFLSNPNLDMPQTLELMTKTQHYTESDTYRLPGTINNVHPVVAGAARQMLNKSANEMSGVLSSLMSNLILFQDPIISENVRTSDFRIEDLTNNKRPLSLYIVAPPSDIARLNPFIRLIISLVLRKLTEKMEFGSNSKIKSVFSFFGFLKKKTTRKQNPLFLHRLLLLIDELPSLGRMDALETALAYIAGYGIKAFLICQSLNQLDKVYGQNNSILDNCHIRSTFASNDDRTAKRISDLLGTTTEEREQKNFAGHRLSPILGHKMVSKVETSRPLLTPGEILQLPDHQQIVFAAGSPPTLANKIRYFENEMFNSRVLPPLDISRAPGAPYPHKPILPQSSWLDRKPVVAPESTPTPNIETQSPTAPTTTTQPTPQKAKPKKGASQNQAKTLKDDVQLNDNDQFDIDALEEPETVETSDKDQAQKLTDDDFGDLDNQETSSAVNATKVKTAEMEPDFWDDMM